MWPASEDGLQWACADCGGGFGLWPAWVALTGETITDVVEPQSANVSLRRPPPSLKRFALLVRSRRNRDWNGSTHFLFSDSPVYCSCQGFVQDLLLWVEIFMG